jgi:hypothetical protein
MGRFLVIDGWFAALEDRTVIRGHRDAPDFRLERFGCRLGMILERGA